MQAATALMIKLSLLKYKAKLLYFGLHVQSDSTGKASLLNTVQPKKKDAQCM